MVTCLVSLFLLLCSSKGTVWLPQILLGIFGITFGMKVLILLQRLFDYKPLVWDVVLADAYILVLTYGLLIAVKFTHPPCVYLVYH